MKTMGKAFLATFLLAAAACGSDGSSADLPDARSADARPPGPDGAVIDGALPGPDAACYDNPTTHFEIINGCTTATALDKDPVLPLRNADGTLPPVP